MPINVNEFFTLCAHHDWKGTEPKDIKGREYLLEMSQGEPTLEWIYSQWQDYVLHGAPHPVLIVEAIGVAVGRGLRNLLEKAEA